MRGLLWRLISTQPPHAAAPSIACLRWEPVLGSSLSSKSNSTNFPSILTHFSVDTVRRRREARLRFKLHWHKRLVWRGTQYISWSRRLTECYLETQVECLSGCLAVYKPVHFPHKDNKCLGRKTSYQYEKKGTISSLSDIYRRGVAEEILQRRNTF